MAIPLVAQWNFRCLVCLDWLGLTAALITGALKADGTLLKLPIGILAALSVLFAFFSGLAGLSSFFGSLLARLRLPAPLHFPAAVVVSILITGGVLWSLVSVFLALLPGGA